MKTVLTLRLIMTSNFGVMIPKLTKGLLLVMTKLSTKAKGFTSPKSKYFGAQTAIQTDRPTTDRQSCSLSLL